LTKAGQHYCEALLHKSHDYRKSGWYVQWYHGGVAMWKDHANIEANAPWLCKVMLSLLKLNLKQRHQQG
jgi:hypothetical protein